MAQLVRHQFAQDRRRGGPRSVRTAQAVDVVWAGQRLVVSIAIAWTLGTLGLQQGSAELAGLPQGAVVQGQSFLRTQGGEVRNRPPIGLAVRHQPHAEVEAAESDQLHQPPRFPHQLAADHGRAVRGCHEGRPGRST